MKAKWRFKSLSTRLERIAELAKKHPERSFRSVHHSIDLEWLAEAARRGRKDGAAGADGQTWTEYEVKLEDNLQAVLDRFKSGTYHAPPVRRVHIPKGDGLTRPIAFQRWRTESCNEGWRWCWKQSASSTSWMARTDSDLGVGRTMHFSPCGTG